MMMMIVTQARSAGLFFLEKFHLVDSWKYYRCDIHMKNKNNKLYYPQFYPIKQHVNISLNLSHSVD
jgi:hypothetical protein